MPAASVKRDQAPERRDADQHRAGGAGEADMRQRMAGEGLAAQHQEEADQPADHRDEPAAAKAFCMKSYVNMVLAMVVLVGIALHVEAARHHEDPAVQPHHVDLGPIEARQHRAGDRPRSTVPSAAWRRPR